MFDKSDNVNYAFNWTSVSVTKAKTNNLNDDIMKKSKQATERVSIRLTEDELDYLKAQGPVLSKVLRRIINDHKNRHRQGHTK